MTLDLRDFTIGNRSKKISVFTLRHGCRVILDFGHPIFDIFYLNNFEMRLSLADATIQMSVETPFGNAEIYAFVDHQNDILRCEIKTDFSENVPTL